MNSVVPSFAAVLASRLSSNVPCAQHGSAKQEDAIKAGGRSKKGVAQNAKAAITGGFRIALAANQRRRAHIAKKARPPTSPSAIDEGSGTVTNATLSMAMPLGAVVRPEPNTNQL